MPRRSRTVKVRRGFAEETSAFNPAPLPAILADACALIVFHLAAGRGMSARALDAMRGRVLVSPVTVWEITLKVASGKLPPIHRADTVNAVDFLAQRGYEPAPLTWEAAALASSLPMHHRDPMDWLLIATAQTMSLPILTNDQVFAAYGVPTLW